MLLDIKAYRHAPAMEPDINSDDYGSRSGSYVITEDNKRVWSNEYNLVFTNDFVNKLIEAAEEVH